LAVHDCL